MSIAGRFDGAGPGAWLTVAQYRRAMSHGPLHDLRVVDLTDLRGALCARILADLGADVIRVETPHLASPPAVSPTLHRYRNANKRGAVADLGTPSGRARVEELLGWADVLVDNLGPVRGPGLGLAPETVAARHPHLVHVALTDLGLDGPRADWHLEALPALAASGALFASGFPHLPPCGLPGHLAHDCAAVHGALGAVAAVQDRARTGLGQVVEVSAQEAALAGTTPWSIAIGSYLHINPYLPAAGTRNADGAYWVLPAADGWVRAVIGSPKQWQGFVGLCGDPDALTGPEWNDNGFRLMNADVIRLVAQERLTDRTRAELFEEALARGATVGVLHTPSEFVAHEQAEHRGFFAATGFPGLADAPFATVPYRLSATPASVRRAAPEPGEDTTGPLPARVVPPPTGGAGLLLDGVRVVEFGVAAVVPELCWMLSELGADVIKIESTTHPDVLRQTGMGRPDCGFAFNTECRGRRSVALDLSTERGRELALELCATADVVAENNRGGVLDRLGLGYAAVAARNPTVVYASSQGYGVGGPFGEMPAYGPLNAGFAGIHLLWNHPEAPYPCGTSLNHPDHIAGKLLAVAVLAALGHRAATGEGQHIDMAQTEAAAYLLGEVYLDAALTGVEPGAAGNRSEHAVPHGVYPAAGDDRWLAVAASDDLAWSRLCSVVGWGSEPALSTLSGRLAARARIDDRLATWTRERSPEEAAATLQVAGVSAMPVMGPLDHHADAHLAARAAIVELAHPEVGPERQVGNPTRFSRLSQRVAPSAPCLGADTAAVLGEVLGIGPDEVAALAAAGVCR
jgi:crotonobetainyl-CoA:carnitine CoA-transferase CaiB-like acyl-CoA transferase